MFLVHYLLLVHLSDSLQEETLNSPDFSVNPWDDEELATEMNARALVNWGGGGGWGVKYDRGTLFVVE
jgi:hypothetical protein